MACALSGPFYHEPLDRNQALGDVVEHIARTKSEAAVRGMFHQYITDFAPVPDGATASNEKLQKRGLLTMSRPPVYLRSRALPAVA